MMKTYFFTLLLIVNGSILTLADEDDASDDKDDSPEELSRCYMRVGEECPIDSLPSDFPKTADELLTICRNVSEQGRCVIRVREDCKDDNKEPITHIQTAVNYIDATCQTGNPTFEAIAGNLECIKEAANASEKVCRIEEYSIGTLILVINSVISLMEDAVYLNEDNSHCVDRLFFIECSAITVGIHCGSKSMGAEYEVLKQTLTYGNKWDDEVMKEMEPLLDLFDEIIMERLNEEDAMHR